MLRRHEVKYAYKMACVTAFDKNRFTSVRLWLSLSVSLCFLGLLSAPALAQQGQNPPQYQQVPGQAVPGLPTTVPVGYGPQGYPQNQGNPVPQQTAQGNEARQQVINQWFQNYDEIRRKAQMSPAERSKADGLMSKAIAMFIPGDDKVQAQKLLTGLVARYNQAVEDFKLLPLYPETERLHRGYYQYFVNARQLFGDYLAVQQNPLATDSAGNTIAATLLPRKQNLEALDVANKQLDGQVRAQFGIPAYRYQ